MKFSRSLEPFRSDQGLATPDSSSGASADKDLYQHSCYHVDAGDDTGRTHETIEHLLPSQQLLSAHRNQQATHKLRLSFRSASSDSSMATVSKLYALYGGDVLGRNTPESRVPTSPPVSSLLATSISEAFLLPQVSGLSVSVFKCVKVQRMQAQSFTWGSNGVLMHVIRYDMIWLLRVI